MGLQAKNCISFIQYVNSNMRPLQNPTTFFFKQAENAQDLFGDQIKQFVSKFIDSNRCTLCKKPYDILTRIPRIMIHCGHTFCTPCLHKFYMNRRIRCPSCLKLVKHLEKVERLPINHTCFKKMVENDQKICDKSGLKPIIIDAERHLFSEFERSQREAHKHEGGTKVDEQTGLPYCVFHPDRIEHFFCSTHESAGCRICSEVGHCKPECKVIDLYEIDDPTKLAEYAKIKEKENKKFDKDSEFVSSAINDIDISDEDDESAD